MANNLIENRTETFFTVTIKDGLYARRAEFAGNNVMNLGVTAKEKDAFKYLKQDVALKVARFTDGSLMKHTRTFVVTETTEEIKVTKEETANG